MFGSKLTYPTTPEGGLLLPPTPRRWHTELSIKEENAEVDALTPEQTVAAMYRGELTFIQLCHWAAKYPDEVARLHGEFIHIAAFTPEVAEATEGSRWLDRARSE